MRTASLILLLTAFLLPVSLPAQTEPEGSSDEPAMEQRRGRRGDRAEQARPGQKRGQRGKRQQGRRGQAGRQMDPQKIFDRFDQDQDGMIAPEEVPERIRERMAKADANEDGAIDVQEFKAHLQKAMMRRGNGRQFSGRPGQGMEGNGTGPMPRRRQAGQQNDRPKMTFRNPENLDADQVMAFLDKNGSGALEKSELPRMMSSKRQKIDSDGDEVISKKELVAAIELMKAKAMDAGQGRYSTNPDSSKGQVPKRPGSGNE